MSDNPLASHEPSETQAETLFAAALFDGRYDDARMALIGGADPNRPLAYSPIHQPQAPCSVLAHAASRLSNRGGSRPAAIAFVELLLEMELRGADFSAPSHPGCSQSGPDEASAVFEGCGARAAATYIRCKATPAILYNEGSFCGLLGRYRFGEPALSELEELWDRGGFREHVQGLPERRTTILTRLIGWGYIQSARWLAAKGALPAPLIQSVPNSHEIEGFGPLHVLAHEMATWGRLDEASVLPRKTHEARRHLTAQTAFECARLATELGASPATACPEGFTPMQIALKSSKASVDAVIAWIRLCKPLGFAPNAEQLPNLASFALMDMPNAARLLALCEDFGASLSQVPPALAIACLGRKKLPEHHDAALLAVCQTLKNRGVDFSKACQEPFHESHPAHAARHCLHGTLQFFLNQGLSPSWREQGLSLMNLALGDSGSHELNKRRMRCLKLLIAAGHPLSLPGTISSPLSLCARHLLRKEFKLLLDSGADPQLAGRDAQTPAHALFVCTGKNSAAIQHIIASSLLADARTPWGSVDNAHRLPLEAACLSSISDECLASILSATPQAMLDESTTRGLRAWKAIRRRGAAFHALAERISLEATSQAKASRKARSAL